jgi:hypothetical protein
MVPIKTVDNKDAPPWDIVKERMLRLPGSGSMTLSVDDDTWLIVLHISKLGYMVTGSGIGEKDYFTLIEPSLGVDPISAFDGGNINDYPRHTFVSEPLLLKATEFYYRTGQRNPECDWVPEEDAVY